MTKELPLGVPWFVEKMLNLSCIFICVNYDCHKRRKRGSLILELQNRVTYCDVTNQVTNSKILFFFLIFQVSNLMWKKNFNKVLELVTQDF